MKIKNFILLPLAVILLAAGINTVTAQTLAKKEDAVKTAPVQKTENTDSVSMAEGQDFRIDQPGTITFKIGVTIKGKIEKPQVMIFLPKEKSYYKKINFAHSFKSDLLEPLPFVPYEE